MLVAARTYHAVLGRVPDFEELLSCKQEIDMQQLTDGQVGRFFAANDEFKARQAEMTKISSLRRPATGLRTVR